MDISFTVFHTSTIFFWVRDIYSVTIHNINLKSRVIIIIPGRSLTELGFFNQLLFSLFDFHVILMHHEF